MSEHDDPTPPASLLIVDDHPANLLALESVLAPIGAQIVCAPSGAEALKAMLKQDFALIIMDAHMDGLDGYQTMRIVRERERARYAEHERMRELFLGVLGHDLRNPLNAIMVATDFLMRHGGLPDQHQRI